MLFIRQMLYGLVPHSPHDETLFTEDYIHRIGRTGRAGKRGVSYTFFHHGDKARAGELVNVLQVRRGAATFEVAESLVGEALCFEGFQRMLCFSCGARFLRGSDSPFASPLRTTDEDGNFIFRSPLLQKSRARHALKSWVGTRRCSLGYPCIARPPSPLLYSTPSGRKSPHFFADEISHGITL